MGLRDVVLIGRRCGDRVNQARVRIHTDMRLHAKVPVVAFLRLMHFRVTLARLVFGRTRCTDDGGVHNRAFFEQQAFLAQQPIDLSQNTGSQLVLRRPCELINILNLLNKIVGFGIINSQFLITQRVSNPSTA